LSTLFTLIPRLLRDPRLLADAMPSPRKVKEHLFLGIIFALLAFAMYGFVMGLSHSLEQALSSAIKLPLLFALTTGVCLAALYTFGLVMVSMRLGLAQLAAVVVSGVGVSAFLLLGLAPVLLFLSAANRSYPFTQLVAGGFVALAGIVGMGYVWRALNQFGFAQTAEATRMARPLLLIWLAMYGFVGAQLAGILGPFVAQLGTPFVLWSRSRDGVVMDMVRALQQVLREGTSSPSALIVSLISIALIVTLVLAVVAMLRRQTRALPVTSKPAPAPRVLGEPVARPPAS
jgi:hypothetical protein